MSFGSSPVLLVLCLLAAAAFTFWTYRTTRPPLHPGKRAVLMGLRWIALAVLLFLGAGAWLDSKLHTVPLFTIVGAFIGGGAGFYSLYYHLVIEPRQRQKEDPR